MFGRTFAAIVAVPLVMQPAFAQEAQEVIVQSQGGSEVRADWVLGGRVTTPDGEMIGSIEDLILDEEDGSVNAAVVSVGGFLGFGAKEIAVDWSELDMNYDANEITLGITREEAEAAPAYNFRDRETAPAPQPQTGTGMDTGGAGMGTGGTGTGMGTTGGTGSGALGSGNAGTGQ